MIVNVTAIKVLSALLNLSALVLVSNLYGVIYLEDYVFYVAISIILTSIMDYGVNAYNIGEGKFATLMLPRLRFDDFILKGLLVSSLIVFLLFRDGFLISLAILALSYIKVDILRWQFITRRDYDPLKSVLYSELSISLCLLISSVLIFDSLLFLSSLIIGHVIIRSYVYKKFTLKKEEFEIRKNFYFSLFYSITTSTKNQISNILVGISSLDTATLVISSRLNQINSLALSGVTYSYHYSKNKADSKAIRKMYGLIVLSVGLLVVLHQSMIKLVASIMGLDVDNFDLFLFFFIMSQTYVSLLCMKMNIESKFHTILAVELAYILMFAIYVLI